MSMPIQANQSLYLLPSLFTTQSPQSGSGTQSPAIFGPSATLGQLATTLEQTAASSAASALGGSSTSTATSGVSATGASASSSQLSAPVQAFLANLKQALSGAASTGTEATASATANAQGGTGTPTSAATAPHHHHGHHHGGGSSWLTNLLDGNSDGNSASSAVTGTNTTLSSSGVSAYALQALGRPSGASSAATTAGTLLAVG